MAKFRKKPETLEAQKWSKKGDHPDVLMHPDPESIGKACPRCGKSGKKHGLLKTEPQELIVCPGDFIVVNMLGKKYPLKPQILETCYEKIKD